MSDQSHNRLPDFFILGGMKCGTTSLFNYLAQHPDILLPEEKELHYYDIHRYQGQTLDEYLERFPGKKEQQITGEATPFYLTHPHCPEWIHGDFPEAKFIVMMRNPVDRFWSQFNQMKRYRHYAGTPEDAIALEKSDGESHWQKALADPEYPVDDLKMCSLLRRGCYASQLDNWLKWFDRDRFLLLFTEDLLRDRGNVVNRALEFLGFNAVTDLRLDKLHHTQEYSHMTDKLRSELEDFYAPHNQRLADFMQVTLPWYIY